MDDREYNLGIDPNLYDSWNEILTPGGEECRWVATRYISSIVVTADTRIKTGMLRQNGFLIYTVFALNICKNIRNSSVL